MLTWMRRLAGTWFAKVLFVLLILSFAVWGIEDMVRNMFRETAVARVGNDTVEVDEAQEAARRELQRISRAIPGFTPDARVRRAIAEQAIDTLVLQRLVAQEAQRMGIAVPDDAVRAYVFEIPQFHGLDGRFSRDMFNSFLRNAELTEGAFLTLLRTDLARQQLTGAIRAGAAVPAALARPLLAWQLERRTATLVELEFAAAPEPAEPTEQQLARFHENNADRFSTPEYRDIAVATLNAARVMADVQVSDRDLEDSYAANRARFETPEQRDVFQALLPEEEAARRIAEAWRSATGFDAVETAAREAGGSASALGTVGRAEIPVPAVAQAAFSLPQGGISDPVRTPFGWAVIGVGTITPGHARAFEEVKEELRAEIAAERAADLAFERANRVEDALAGGATLAEIARRYSLGYAEARIDAQGRAPDGTMVSLPVADAARTAALREIFTTNRGDAPRLKEGEWGFMAVDVRDVTPPALRPLDTVRDQVREAFLADARRRFQEERAAAIMAAVRGGKTLVEAATEAGATPEEIGPFPRQPGGGNPMPRELLPPVFELRVNEATMVQRPLSFAVVQLLSVQPADLDAATEALTALRGEVSQSVADDLEAQWTAALRARGDVRINRRLLEQVAGPAN
jgi:peptidyl-prolyl cis-trans isomerase D